VAGFDEARRIRWGDRRGLVAQVVSLAREVVQQRTELADMGERIRDHLLIDDSDRFGDLSDLSR